MKRKFKLIFRTSPGVILNVEKFKSLKGKLPLDVDIFRRRIIWEQTKVKDPYIVYLSEGEYSEFVKEFKQKLPRYGVSNSICIQDTSEVIVKIQII